MILHNVFRDLFRRRADSPGLLSVVVNFFNNRREARNSLFSLTRGYQIDSGNIPYEVIAIDNGSTEPLSEADVRSFGSEFHYRYVPTRSVSPVEAINEAARAAAGDRLMILIDGAHIVTPRVLRLVYETFQRFRAPFIATVPFQLGPMKQNFSVQAGYNQQVEDELLGRSGWRDNGYRLYSAAASFADEGGGWYGQLFESGCFAMRKADYLAMAGSTSGSSPPGADSAISTFSSARWRDRSSNTSFCWAKERSIRFTAEFPRACPWSAIHGRRFHEEFKRIRGRRFVRIPRRPVFVGETREEAAQAEEFSRRIGEETWARNPAIEV
jgi:hypothetical protein